jgi:prepilin-type N-terminal cleavage/methylation domain-containing protein
MKRGFSIIEVIVVIGIILIMTGLTTSLYSRFYKQNSAANTTVQLAGSLRKAQMYSMNGRRNTRWGVRYGSNTITLFSGYTYANRNTTFDENFSVDASTAISGFTELYFNSRTGTPSATPTITITNGSTTRTISLTSEGAINVQ